MDDEPMYFIDARNADVRDQRRVLAAQRGRVAAVVPASSRVVYAPPAAAVPAYQQPQFVGQPQIFGSFSGAAPVYSPGPMGQPWGTPFMGQLGQLFGGLTLGDVAKLIGFGFSAFKSLPVAPTPTGDVATDLANDVIFQAAIAAETKLEKQIEFGSNVIGELLGAR